MAFADHLPISESIGVFVGVSGFDWLAEGQAEPLKALLSAVFCGALLFFIRSYLRKRQQ